MGLWPRCVDDRGLAYEFQASTVQTWRDRAKRKNGVPLALGSLAVVAALATAGESIGTVKSITPGITTEVTAVKTDGAAQLKWE